MTVLTVLTGTNPKLFSEKFLSVPEYWPYDVRI